MKLKVSKTRFILDPIFNLISFSFLEANLFLKNLSARLSQEGIKGQINRRQIKGKKGKGRLSIIPSICFEKGRNHPSEKMLSHT